jgi:hypothetical protein
MEMIEKIQKTLDSAKLFLKLLPEDIEQPHIIIQSDGDINFEWYKSLDQIINISIRPDGLLYLRMVTIS